MVRSTTGAQRSRSGSSRDWPYALRGGPLCLELVNTLAWRHRMPIEDRLRDYPALLAWGVRAGAVAPEEALRLRAAARRRSASAQRALRTARRLREAIYAVFAAAAARRVPRRRELDVLNAALGRAHAQLRLSPRSGRLAWRWGDPAAMDRVLWPVARSAAALLTSPDLTRVRSCGDPECGWLFLDTSRNGSRRWCSMSDCGNRAKARRHYRRRSARSSRHAPLRQQPRTIPLT